MFQPGPLGGKRSQTGRASERLEPGTAAMPSPVQRAGLRESMGETRFGRQLRVEAWLLAQRLDDVAKRFLTSLRPMENTRREELSGSLAIRNSDLPVFV